MGFYYACSYMKNLNNTVTGTRAGARYILFCHVFHLSSYAPELKITDD